LTHRYNKSLIEPVGFDNILLLAARKLQFAHTHLLPSFANAAVIATRRAILINPRNLKGPFTDAHIDFILGDKDALERESAQWPKGVEEIPFWGLSDPWKTRV
jgi:hypothetical protein